MALDRQGRQGNEIGSLCGMGRQLVYTFAADVLGCSGLVDALADLQG